MGHKDPARTVAYKHQWYLDNREKQIQKQIAKNSIYTLICTLEYCIISLNAWNITRKKHRKESKQRSYQIHKIDIQKQHKLYYANNKQKHYERGRKWSQANPIKVKQSQNKWVALHPEERRLSSRIWAAKQRILNPSIINKKHREWRKNNPQKAKAKDLKFRLKYRDKRFGYTIKRMALKRGASFGEFITLIDIAIRDNWRCHICKKKVTRRTWSLDHLIPLSQGGLHIKINVSLAHRSCNSKRGVGRLPAQLLLFD